MNERELSTALDNVVESTVTGHLRDGEEIQASLGFVQTRAMIRISENLALIAMEMACLKEYLFGTDQKLQVLINVLDNIE